jgi:hypothetical protein
VHCANGLPLQWLSPSELERARHISAFQPEAKPGEAFSPIGAGGLPAKSGRPVVGGGVAGEQAGYERGWIFGSEETVFTEIGLPPAAQSEWRGAAVGARMGC